MKMKLTIIVLLLSALSFSCSENGQNPLIDDIELQFKPGQSITIDDLIGKNVVSFVPGSEFGMETIDMTGSILTTRLFNVTAIRVKSGRIYEISGVGFEFVVEQKLLNGEPQLGTLLSVTGDVAIVEQNFTSSGLIRMGMDAIDGCTSNSQCTGKAIPPYEAVCVDGNCEFH